MQTWKLTEIDLPDGKRDPLVLHSDDEARAVLIELKPGQSLGEHQVKENAWLCVVEGSARVGAGADVVEAGPGTLFRFEPDERHSVGTAQGARLLLLLAPWPGRGHYRGSTGGAG